MASGWQLTDENKSRKLWYGVGTSISMVLCAIAAAKYPTFGINLNVLFTSLIGTYAVYAGTNIGSKWLQGLNNPVPSKEDPSGQPIEQIPEE